MKFFQIIASSSSGNCSLLQCANKKILIDAGITLKALREYLSELNLKVEDIDAIFITHEHSDHCKMLGTLSKFPHINVFASETTAEMILSSMPAASKLKWKIFYSSTSFQYEDILVDTVSLPHDASETVSYKFSYAGKSLTWATDLGHLTDKIKITAKTSDILVLESNYDSEMLDNSDRPYNLKKRIRGTHGHLSNEDCFAFLNEIDFEKFHKVYLAHISKQCNDVEIVKSYVSKLGAKSEKVEIVCPHKGRSSVARLFS